MPLAAGTRLGPHEVLGLVGAGGMGEVYRARDPRLGRDVAIKVLPAEVGSDPGRLRRFEQEARAVAALNHPNILTVHDVGTHEGVPYVVTELLEGETLREMASRRAPTQRQVLALAVQAAQGLEAAHAKGIVHRDVKPENLFVTTDGRVKVLDFGLATTAGRLASGSAEATESSPTDAGRVVGTVGYMSPEQVRGLAVDARTDVFSLGVVLYELLSGTHPFRRKTTVATLTAVLEERPAELSTLGRGVPPAASAIVRRCLEKGREERYASARDVRVAIEAVLAAPAGSPALEEVEERSPYPGLSSFTEKDAALFFGRESEIRGLWERVRNRRLLAVIGPSGAGKTSFLRAGVIPARPDGWGAACATPGASPFLGLARALTPEMAGDPEAIAEMLGGVADVVDKGDADRVVAAARRWRSRHEQALLVVDQLEELFTQSPPQTQERFATLLARLASEADVHVVLSMRDDFLMRCHDQPALVPVFTELTPLGALTKAGLRSALVEPAAKRGYRFEDEALVDEMVAAVEGARGALPLLAFAVSRLWETRDRERKRLTRSAYEEIGGVAGALAQHAEATLESVGAERQGLVREVFRNLVSAQGTRVSIDREELFSAFPDRKAAEEVLGQLVDARLLTSYEVEEGAGSGRHRVEIVHESLLGAWPRLVRWRAQDEEGAVLRDQLRLAAHLWGEKGRTSDLLWTGTAYQEFELWRGRYAGALTALEEDFAKAMAEKARRRKRRLTAAVAAVIVALAGLAIGIGVSRQRAARARDRAQAEALHAESAKLLAVAQLRLADDPTEALAFATASLELVDTKAAREFVMKALWESPPARELVTPNLGPVFSPDGRRLALGGHSEAVQIWSDDGRLEARLGGHEVRLWPTVADWVSNDRIVTEQSVADPGRLVRVWSIPDGRLVRTLDLGAPGYCRVIGQELVCGVPKDPAPQWRGEARLLSWRLSDGEPTDLGRFDRTPEMAAWELTRRGFAYARGRQLFWRPPPGSRADGDRLFGRHDADIVGLDRWRSDRLSSFDEAGRYRLWVTTGDGFALEGELQRPADAPATARPGPNPRWLFAGGDGARARLWDLASLPGARPLVLRRAGSSGLPSAALHPAGDWLVVAGWDERVDFWPVRNPRPAIVDGCRATGSALAFSADGRWLVTSCGPAEFKALHLWPLPGTGPRILGKVEAFPLLNLALDPGGRYVFGVGFDRSAVIPMDGSPARILPSSQGSIHTGAAVSPSGRRVATAHFSGSGEKKLYVWDVESGAAKAFDLPPLPPPDLGRGVTSAAFADESTLYTSGGGGLRRWNVEDGTSTLVSATPGLDMKMALVPGGRQAVTRLEPYESAFGSCSGIERRDLGTGKAEPLPAFGDCVFWGFAVGADGQVVAAGGKDGSIRVGRLSGGEPHLLSGHKGAVLYVAISPDLRWVASVGEDNTLRLWPMPDLSKPPLHSRPPEELLATLHSLTNLRAVREASSPTGWKVEVVAFPGWRDMPAW